MRPTMTTLEPGETMAVRSTIPIERTGSDGAESVEFENPSGIDPLEYNVLVLPDPVGDHEFYGADGKAYQIIKTQETLDQEAVASTVGTVMAVSDTAFTFENGAQAVEPGDRVVFARYAGLSVDGLDKDEAGRPVKYLIIKDQSVCGVYRRQDDS